MENIEQKIQFLQNDYFPILKTLPVDAQPLFGKMSPQHMVEHMAEYIRLGYGNPIIDVQSYSNEVTDKMRTFLMSEKPFRPNTPNPLMNETPAALKYADMGLALEDLHKSIGELFDTFETTHELRVHNPFFGSLDKEMTIQLLAKHAQHHLRQFGLWD